MADERRDESSQGNPDRAEPAGRQVGGGPGPSDMAAPGGSSGSGGYGRAQNQQFHQGQQQESAGRVDGLSRGERFDEAQGGGRGADDLATGESEFAEDQAEHQDRGQSVAEAEAGSER